MSTPKPRAAYQSDDRELLVGLYRWLFWRWMVVLIPRWVSPNALTLVGLAASVAAVGAALGGVAGYRWMYLASGALLFVYVTLDNLDGAHARRTGQSSRLGELLDHGLDGLASGSMFLIGAIVLHLDPLFTVILLVSGTGAFVLTLWEQYRTNVLIIPQMSGTEGVTMVAFLNTLAFVYDDPPWMHLDVTEWSFSTGILVFVLLTALANLIPPILRARKAGARASEAIPPLALLLAVGAFPLAGADPVLTGGVIGVLGSDLGARCILLRQAEREDRVVPPSRLLVLLPLVPALLVRTPDVANASAAASLAISSGLYLKALVDAARALPHPGRDPAA